MTKRSWLKLDKTTTKPWFSLPSKFSTGTKTCYKQVNIKDRFCNKVKIYYIFKGDISSTSTRGVRSLDRLCLNAFATFNQKHRHTLISLYSNREKIGPTATGNPLLCTIDKIMFTISCLDSSGSDTCYVWTSKGFSNSKADSLLAWKDIRNILLLPVRVRAVHFSHLHYCTFFFRAGVPKLIIVGAEITIPATEPSSKPRTFQRAVSSWTMIYKKRNFKSPDF